MIVDAETLHALEWEAVCALLAEHSNAPLARRALAGWRPYADADAARGALAEVAEAIDLVGEGAVPVPYVEDQSRTIHALAVAGTVLEGPALVSAARTLETVRRLAAFLRRGRDRWPRLAARLQEAPSEPALERRLIDPFDEEGRLVDEASGELLRLRGDVRRHRAALVDLLAALIGGLPHVLVAADSRPTVREGRYVVPLRREALSEVPGIVHDESVSGATVFLEPHVAVERNNALRQTELAVRREEERILRELTAALAERQDALEHAARLALHVETVLARARYALAVGGHPPAIGGEALVLVAARHPLLVARQRAGEIGHVVSLDFELGPDERTLVVTGPNTGGKTVLLKTVGIVTLLAQSGVIPPVGRGTLLPWHGVVVADIGDTQSIAQDLSTFTAHLTRLRTATESARQRALVLVDEIGASTDPAEGSALAAALLEAWTAAGARTIVTTHYHALKVLGASAAGFVNGSLAYDVERNLPLYRFVQGVPGRSFGLQLAGRWGFPAAVLKRADVHLSEDARQLDEVVDRLAAEERAFATARHALDAERRAIGDAESARARKLTAEAAARREDAERRLTALEEQLDRLRDELRRQQCRLRERTAALAEAEAAARASQTLAAEAERTAAALRAEQDALRARAALPPVEPGDRVRIPRYDVVGDVVVVDREADTAAVQAGPVRITCRASEVEVIERRADRVTVPEVVDPAGGDGGPETEPALEIDLRGMTADEVGYPVAGALERAYHTARPAIRFIHGKGTGVLRRKVAELLTRHPYVQEFRLGHWNEGGDGVTIATIDLHQPSGGVR